VASTIAAHGLTFVIVRMVATQCAFAKIGSHGVAFTWRGRREFLDAIAWRWTGPSPGAQFGLVVGIAVGLILVGVFFNAVLPQSHETDFEKLIKTSQQVRILVAFTAVFTAPIVEEGVYRGLLYPALSRTVGMRPAVIVVSTLFFGVHVFQYSGSAAALATIAVLSLTLTTLRAKAGSFLPCLAVHTLYNAIGSVGILLQGTHHGR